MRALRVIYKCRLCGKEVIDGTIASKTTAYSAVSSLACVGEGAIPQDLRMHSIHSCADGSIGITDFQGVRKEETCYYSQIS